jgi:hypothetical protein
LAWFELIASNSQILNNDASSAITGPRRADSAYAQGLGTGIDAETAYTWADTSPDGGEMADGIEVDSYDALEIWKGTTLTF